MHGHVPTLYLVFKEKETTSFLFFSSQGCTREPHFLCLCECGYVWGPWNGATWSLFQYHHLIYSYPTWFIYLFFSAAAACMTKIGKEISEEGKYMSNLKEEKIYERKKFSWKIQSWFQPIMSFKWNFNWFGQTSIFFRKCEIQFKKEK